MTEVNAELKKMQSEVGESSGDGSNGDGEEVGEAWEGIEEDAPAAKAVPDDEEYVDEDKYTTVTVEAMDGENDGPDDSEDEDNLKVVTVPDGGQGKDGVLKKKRIHNKDGQAKPKKKKFRYESKAERQTTRQKQKAKNHKAKLRRTGK